MDVSGTTSLAAHKSGVFSRPLLSEESLLREELRHGTHRSRWELVPHGSTVTRPQGVSKPWIWNQKAGVLPVSESESVWVSVPVHSYSDTIETLQSYCSERFFHARCANWKDMPMLWCWPYPCSFKQWSSLLTKRWCAMVKATQLQKPTPGRPLICHTQLPSTSTGHATCTHAWPQLASHIAIQTYIYNIERERADLSRWFEWPTALTIHSETQLRDGSVSFTWSNNV